MKCIFFFFINRVTIQYILLFTDMFWPGFLNWLKCPGFGFVFLFTCSLLSSYKTWCSCMHEKLKKAMQCYMHNLACCITLLFQLFEVFSALKSSVVQRSIVHITFHCFNRSLQIPLSCTPQLVEYVHMPALYRSNYFKVITFSKYANKSNKKPRPGHLMQFRKPGQDKSRKKGCQGHPILNDPVLICQG